MCLFLGIPTKEKEELNPGVLGYYDCKPYHNFHFALIYAKDIEVYNDEKIEDANVEEIVDANIDGDTAEFEAESFSIYAFVVEKDPRLLVNFYN